MAAAEFWIVIHEMAFEVTASTLCRASWIGSVSALLGPGHPDLDDLAQQSFIEIVLSLHRYRGECSLSTWAATIAARTVFKFLRRRTTERKIFRDPEPGAEDLASPSSLTRSLVARNTAERIRMHMAQMDPAKAEAFVLHDVCGFEAREIAGIVGRCSASQSGLRALPW